MNLYEEDRRLWILEFAGFCGEMPMELVRRLDGYYDYNRRLVTKLVKDGCLRERHFVDRKRHTVRSLSLTSDGLAQIRLADSEAAALIARHPMAPADGQGDWMKTRRLHRGAQCLFMAMRIGAVWKPGPDKDQAFENRQLVYYGSYEMNKRFQWDNKGARFSGVLIFCRHQYYPLYYLGDSFMSLNYEKEAECNRRFENRMGMRENSCLGYILLAKGWELAASIIRGGIYAGSSMIQLTHRTSHYYVTCDQLGEVMLSIIVDHAKQYRFEKLMKDLGIWSEYSVTSYLFDLRRIQCYSDQYGRLKHMEHPVFGTFLDSHRSVLSAICSHWPYYEFFPDGCLTVFAIAEERKEKRRDL